MDKPIVPSQWALFDRVGYLIAHSAGEGGQPGFVFVAQPLSKKET